MAGIKDKLARVLRDKPTVITRAVFWSIPHDSAKEDICLKIGRYKKSRRILGPEEPEVDHPKSELTLDDEEFKALIKFVRENYEPFRHGTKAFIPLDTPYDAENAAQIRALFSLPDKHKLIEFILANDIIPEDLATGLLQARRVHAVRQFEAMLHDDKREQNWQSWFKQNSWVLGSEFVRVLDDRHIDTQNISDFLMEAYDGFLDVIEIKRPGGGLRFWAESLDHGNYVPSSDLTKAITQANRYIFEVEREANSLKFLERVGEVRIVKPRCILIFGRSNQWDSDQIEAYRIMNAGFHNLNIMTYDHVLGRAKRMVGIDPPRNGEGD
jgi:antiviral defense system Shedu protein SduA